MMFYEEILFATVIISVIQLFFVEVSHYIFTVKISYSTSVVCYLIVVTLSFRDVVSYIKVETHVPKTV